MRVSVTPHVRWRSPRRRSNEKSAKQIQREFQQDIRTLLEHPRLVTERGLRTPRTPPHWLVKGAFVDYHDGTNGPPVLSCTVLTPPFQIRDQWCALLDKKRGWVPIEALTQTATTTK